MPAILSTVIAGNVLTSGTSAVLVAAALFEFITEQQLADWPPPAYLVDGLLQAGSFALLFGAPGGGKTFLALALALSVATGTAILGRTVPQAGPVVYIIAEGAPGNFARRVAAWKQAHGYEGPVDVHFLPSAVTLTDPASLGKLIASLKALPVPPVLIVIDTLARCFDGDENSAEDMGGLVAAGDRLRHETGAAVLLVHHSGWEGKHERGSNSLRGAIDTVFSLCNAKKPGRLVLTVEKQKDDEEPPPIQLALDPVPLPDGATSCVIRLVDAPGSPEQLSEKQGAALKMLALAGPGGLAHGHWKVASGLTNATFNRVLKSLVETGQVIHEGEKYIASAKYIAAPTEEPHGE